MPNTLELPLGKAIYVVTGGPYRGRTNHYVGVKMAEELNLPCDVDVPTEDFSVPPMDVFDKGLADTVEYILAGKPVYIGCMGGVGRTGLMLACLAKSFGVPDPVKYVRKNYNGHAVETSRQEEFVRIYEPHFGVTFQIRMARFFNLFDKTGPLKTNLPKRDEFTR